MNLERRLKVRWAHAEEEDGLVLARENQKAHRRKLAGGLAHLQGRSERKGKRRNQARVGVAVVYRAVSLRFGESSVARVAIVTSNYLLLFDEPVERQRVLLDALHSEDGVDGACGPRAGQSRQGKEKRERGKARQGSQMSRRFRFRFRFRLVHIPFAMTSSLPNDVPTDSPDPRNWLSLSSD